ncbi:MAG: adenylate kinase family enzyme [Flammeovirgaceae bacterium]|jgi:adenylate kinase family enzyme
MKTLIFGASGSGTSTLGRELESKSDFKHLDVDDNQSCYLLIIKQLR